MEEFVCAASVQLSSPLLSMILQEARGQRQKGSLVEPEVHSPPFIRCKRTFTCLQICQVLHLLWQHEAVFQALHAAYADHEGVIGSLMPILLILDVQSIGPSARHRPHDVRCSHATLQRLFSGQFPRCKRCQQFLSARLWLRRAGAASNQSASTTHDLRARKPR